MSKLLKNTLFIVLGILAFSSCSNNTLKSPDAYFSYLNDPDNGLIKEKYINGINFKVKYLSPEYIIYQQLKLNDTIDHHEYDSLVSVKSQTITIMMTIGPDERESVGGDIVYRGIANYEEYKNRIFDLNFEIENMISLRMAEKTYFPVLSSFENIYEAKNSRDILFVFSPNIKEDESFYASEELDFVYEDEIFNTGINHFIIRRKDILETPKIDFLK